MKKLALFIVLIFIGITVKAQITFQKTYGGASSDWGNSILQTNDGGFIIAGTTGNFGAGYQDVYLVKTASDGTLQWTKTFGRIEWDEALGLVQTNDSGFIITHSTESFGPGGFNVNIVKTSSDGTLQWTKTYGGPLMDQGNSILQTNDGGFIIMGSTESFGAGSWDVYLVKTASDGTLQWTKTYGGPAGESGQSILQTNDGGFIITGSTGSFGEGYQDVYLVKTASDGTLQWTKTYGGPLAEIGNSILQTNDGGFIIMGSTESFGAGGWDVYLVKTASDGTLQWTKTYGGPSIDQGRSILQTNDGGFIIAGLTESFGAGSIDVYLVKTASDGTLQWTKTYGGIEWDDGRSILQTNDGGFIIAGLTESFGAGTAIYLIKTDSYGNSGCNETSPTSWVSSGGNQGTGGTQGTGGVTSNPAIQTSTGGFITPLCSTNGVSEIVSEDILNIFPNPATKEIFISNKNGIINEVKIYNHLGQIVLQETRLTNVIEVSMLRQGMYVIEVVSKEWTIREKLIIK